jgi:NAD(P)-dependent dehydrogenase (short-subunit alcohol dehydrogenase family)
MMNEYANLFDMRGKVVFAAGGAGAIGAEMARALAAFGAKIAIADIQGDAVLRVTADLKQAGYSAMGTKIDVMDVDTVAAAVAEVDATLGTVDVLVNTAGTHIEQPAHELDIKAWDTVLGVNLRGAFILSQAVSRSMIANGKGGSHIHITSVRSSLGIRRGYAAYCASKGGLGILIKQLATEWAPFGIRVNGIAPTFTRTPLVENYLNDQDFYNALVQRIPLGRVCETRDLAGIAVFLASEASAFITGQNIFVDGGVTATQ